MQDSPHRTAFVLAAVAGHAMILNRFDQGVEDGAGVGASLLELGSHETGEIGLIAEIAAFKRVQHGDGVAIIDGGANIGTHTIAWARLMAGWGRVMAFEPQERTFYALCGNIALNNCFNASAVMVALSAKAGVVSVPRLDPQQPANFGGLSLKPDLNKQGKGTGNAIVPATAIDDIRLNRLDILKLDVEGMEPEVLDGARQTIDRLKPVIFVETQTCGNIEVAKRLPGYKIIQCGMSALAVHESDETLRRLSFVGEGAISFEGGA